MPRRGSQQQGVLMALIGAVLFGVSGVVAVEAFDQVTTVTMTQFRTTTAAVILSALGWRHLKSLRSHVGEITVLGGFLAAVTITYYIAILRLGVGPGVTIQFLGPAMVLVWMRAVQGRAVPAAAWMAAGIAVAGTAMMNRAWDLASADPVGLMAGLGSAVAFAGYLIMGERLGRALPEIAVGAGGFTVAAAIWLVASPPAVPVVSAPVWGQMIWVGVAGTTLPFLLELGAVRRADPGRVGVVVTAEPLVAAAAAWIALGEALQPVQIAGAVAVATGIAIIQVVTNSVAPDVPDLVV